MSLLQLPLREADRQEDKTCLIKNIDSLASVGVMQLEEDRSALVVAKKQNSFNQVKRQMTGDSLGKQHKSLTNSKKISLWSVAAPRE